MASSGQQSTRQSTENGIKALTQAYNGVKKIKGDVDSTRGGLTSGFQGSDGSAYSQLLQAWDGQAEIILRNLDQMITQLQNTLKEHDQVQRSNNDSIGAAGNRVAQTLIGR